LPVVSARHLSKSYGPQTLFEDISITVRSGERLGLLGANGAGKSTLLRVLAGTETVDVGVIDRRRGARVLYLAQEPVLDDAATPRQLVEQGLLEWHAATNQHAELTRALEAGASEVPIDVLLEEQARLAETIEHLGGWSRDHVALAMLGHLGVHDVDRAVGTMSGGERRRVALAQILVSEPALAILDEPTNHLDTETIEWLEEFLANEFRGAVLMVTHDRYVLDAVADRIIELEQGKLTEFQGGYGDYLEQKAELIAQAGRVESNRLNLLRRERAWLQRGAKARSTKQKARVQRAQALVSAEGPKETEGVNLAGLEAGASRTGKTILDFQDAGLDLGGRTLIRSLTLNVVTGERMGIVGVNGVGKTSLLRLVSQELSPTSGKVVLGSNTRIVYFDQARSGLRDDWSIFDNVAEREGAERGAADVVKIGDRILEMRTYLEQFLFDGSKQRQKVGALSGGERARVALAKALRTGANLLLLDEPTNDLDVATLGALEELLEGWPGCALIVSHDRYFLDRVATSTLAFEGDGVVKRYPGGYGTYRSLRNQAEADAAAVKTAKEVPRPEVKTSKVEAGLKPLTAAEKKELDGLLDLVSLTEARIQKLEERLASPELYAGDPEETRSVRADHARAKEELLIRTLRWEELETRRDVKAARPPRTPE
jgi:ATP-binding cassette subfamily F protein uup